MKLLFSCIFCLQQSEIDVKELFPENFNVNIPLGGLMGD